MYFKPDGMIIVESRYDGFLVLDYVTGWEGGRYADVDRQFVPEGAHPGQIIEFGPYRVKLLRKYPWNDRWLVVRIDHWLWFYITKYKLMRTWELFFQRFLLTLAIWQLAETPINAYPTWHDIKLVKWFGKKLAKKETTLDV